MDPAELAPVMDRALQEQRERLAATPAGPARERIANFLAYYERRRAALEAGPEGNRHVGGPRATGNAGGQG